MGGSSWFGSVKVKLKRTFFKTTHLRDEANKKNYLLVTIENAKFVSEVR